MSNTITIRKPGTQVKSLTHARMAAEALGLVWRESAANDLSFRVHGSDGRQNAAAVASLPDNARAYELGFVWDEKDQCWYPRCDTFMGGNGLLDKVNFPGSSGEAHIDRFMALYRLALARQEAEAAGMVINVVETPEGYLLEAQEPAHNQPEVAAVQTRR